MRLDFSAWRRPLGRAAESVLEWLADRRGYELVRDDYYSPLPDIGELPASVLNEEQRPTRLDLGLERSELLLTRDLAPLIPDLRASAPESLIPGFSLSNGTYESADAETLYAMVRLLSPSTIVELGSGASSHIISAARATLDAPSKHIIHDPFPFSATQMGPVPDATISETPTQLLSPDDLSILGPGDLLFIDTTHTVKTGGDCARLYLDLLPSVAPGVFVHIHDVFTPFDYPRHWVVDLGRAWAEQYLLEAFLLFNDDFRVVLPVHALSRLKPEAVAAVIPSFRSDAFSPAVFPAAFWLVRLPCDKPFLR